MIEYEYWIGLVICEWTWHSAMCPTCFMASDGSMLFPNDEICPNDWHLKECRICGEYATGERR